MPDDRPPIICSTISVFSKPIDAAFPLFAPRLRRIWLPSLFEFVTTTASSVAFEIKF